MSIPISIYHNPRCSKSRQTLALLTQNGIQPEIILYLENPPTAKALKQILNKLKIPARALLRRSENEYRELGLAETSLSETALIEAMCRYPKLIERPVVVRGDRAVLGRPPENVLTLLQ
ncbi:MAG: arsenate reductase (glutaredoxin) [Pseudomonadales bacterium]|nr:arsenate reductase (glutaredoxin) [Pseudomonadales bacterium]